MSEFSLSAGVFIVGVGKASMCECSDYHSPVPLRFVWHHILPLACGGRSTADNLIQVCDSCHYAIHRMMSDMVANNGELVEFKRFARTKRAAVAEQGYLLAKVMGTLTDMPKELHHGEH